jgi:hypothetical protein
MSNGIFLTQKDLEKYLSECNKFIKEKYENEKIVQFEFEELVKDIEYQIHENIKKYETIELVVSDIKKREQIKDEVIWNDYIEETIQLRGNEKIGKWDPYGDYRRDIYIIEYTINYFNYINPFRYEVVFTDINFFEILSTKLQNIKRGDKRKLELNFYRPVKYSVFTGTDIRIRYYNKSNLLPISIKVLDTNLVTPSAQKPIIKHSLYYRLLAFSFLSIFIIGVYCFINGVTFGLGQEEAFALFGLIQFLGLTSIFWLLKNTKWFGWLWTCWWILWGVFIASLFLNKGKKSIKEWWNKD